MRLGIGYNLFDGEEILPYSLRSIRAAADYVCVVYQTVSNYGALCDPELLPLLEGLRTVGLIDELINYRPRLRQNPFFNEIAKRNLALEAARDAGCTHFMSIDADEVYRPEQLAWAKADVERGDWPGSVCLSAIYYRSPRFRMMPGDATYFAMIYKLYKLSRFVFDAPFPVLVDPTRRIPRDRVRIFTRDELEMHHYAYVRRNLRVKLGNSSARFAFEKDVEALAVYHERWRPGNRAWLPLSWQDIIEVEPVVDFNVDPAATDAISI